VRNGFFNFDSVLVLKKPGLVRFQLKIKTPYKIKLFKQLMLVIDCSYCTLFRPTVTKTTTKVSPS